MLGTLIGILLTLLILGLIVWAIQQFIGLIPLGEPFATAVRVVIYCIIALIAIWFIVQLLSLAGIHVTMPFGTNIR